MELLDGGVRVPELSRWCGDLRGFVKVENFFHEGPHPDREQLERPTWFLQSVHAVQFLITSSSWLALAVPAGWGERVMRKKQISCLSIPFCIGLYRFFV